MACEGRKGGRKCAGTPCFKDSKVQPSTYVAIKGISITIHAPLAALQGDCGVQEVSARSFSCMPGGMGQLDGLLSAASW